MRPRRDAVIAAYLAALALAPNVGGAQQPAAEGALIAVHGLVYDSLSRRPLASAYVQIARTDDVGGGRAVAADSAGVFRIDSLAPGRYFVSFLHPLLNLLQVQVRPRLIELAPGDDAVRVDLGVPDLAVVRPVVCGNSQAPSDSTGMLAGRVRDAADDTPIANATVVLTWTERSLGAGGVRTEHRRVPVATGPGGGYVVCGVPAGEEIVVSAAAPGRASGEVALEIPVRGLLERDLSLGDTTAVVGPVTHGTARVIGTVRDSAGRPVRGARVNVRGASAETIAGADGAFTLGGLPAGTRTLEVRALGFVLQRVPVDLAAGRAAAVDVRLDRVLTLAPVNVVATATSGLAGFFDRRTRKVADWSITAEDIERSHAFVVSDVLRGMTAVSVVSDGHLGTRLLGTSLQTKLHGGKCQARIVLNGRALPPGDDIDRWVDTKDVAGIEVYANAAFAPAQYRPLDDPDACSVVLVWTRQ